MSFWKGYAVAALISCVIFVIRLLFEGEGFWKEMDHRLLHSGYKITSAHRIAAFLTVIVVVVLAPPIAVVLNLANIYLLIGSESEDEE